MIQSSHAFEAFMTDIFSDVASFAADPNEANPVPLFTQPGKVPQTLGRLMILNC